MDSNNLLSLDVNDPFLKKFWAMSLEERQQIMPYQVEAFTGSEEWCPEKKTLVRYESVDAPGYVAISSMAGRVLTYRIENKPRPEELDTLSLVRLNSQELVRGVLSRVAVLDEVDYLDELDYPAPRIRTSPKPPTSNAQLARERFQPFKAKPARR